MTGLSVSQKEKLEEKVLSTPRIYVDNDALAFFDCKPKYEHVRQTDIAEIVNNPSKFLHSQEYNFLVEEKGIHYFRIGEYEGPFSTVSVTGCCVVFCAFTRDEQGRIKSSGVYHALSLLPEEVFLERLDMLIDTVGLAYDKPITIKAAGADQKSELQIKKLRKNIPELLSAKNVITEPEYILLGGGYGVRTTEFNPQIGQLITWPSILGIKHSKLIYNQPEQKSIL